MASSVHASSGLSFYIPSFLLSLAGCGEAGRFLLLDSPSDLWQAGLCPQCPPEDFSQNGPIDQATCSPEDLSRSPLKSGFEGLSVATDNVCHTPMASAVSPSPLSCPFSLAMPSPR